MLFHGLLCKNVGIEYLPMEVNMQKRNPKGLPTGGRFSSHAHDDAAPLTSTISDRMESIRGDDSHRTEFSTLALANTAEAVRSSAPDVSRIRLLGNRHSFHALGFYGADGTRRRISDEDFSEVQRRLDEANPGICIRNGLVSQTDDPEGRGRKFFYEMDVDSAISAGRPRELVGA